MAMYSAYFDESGHPDDSAYVVVAGAIADVDQWVHFEREWKEALAPLNTSVFHAVDLEAGNPPFDNLNERQKTSYSRNSSASSAEELKRLVQVACKWRITTFAIAGTC
jgi:hypothetical protein